MLVEFTPELVAGAAGIVLSWLFSWFPGLRAWYAGLKQEVKSGIMLGLLACISIVIYVSALYGLIDVPEPITIIDLVKVFFIASTLNQTAYSLTPQASDVKSIKQMQKI